MIRERMEVTMLDQGKIGKFIAERRKSQNMTQKQMAEQLGVSDKAVSKWETGKSMPDNSLLLDLCSLLEININELLSGEKLSQDNYHGKAEENMTNLMGQTEKEKKKSKSIIQGVVLGSFLLALALFSLICLSNGDIAWYLDFPSLFIVVSITFFVLLISGLIKDFFKAFRIVFGNEDADAIQIKRSVAAFNLVLVTVFLVGIITTLISLITILPRELEIAYMEKNLAVASLTTLYGWLFDLVLLPIAARLWVIAKTEK